jgi:hypothetical protein
VSAGGGPRFDESLASAARGLHVAELAVAAVVVAAVLFWHLERRGRARWGLVPASRFSTSRAPYRASAMIGAHLAAAPRLVRAAAFASLTLGLLFGPLIVLAVVKYPFDGIAIPLVPGLALQLLNWTCAWLFLARSPLAVATARSGAVGALMANVGLLGIAGAHFATVELQRRDGIEHACSSSVTFVVIVFAICSVVQSLLTIAALRRYAHLLDWQPAAATGQRVTPSRVSVSSGDTSMDSASEAASASFAAGTTRTSTR